MKLARSLLHITDNRPTRLPLRHIEYWQLATNVPFRSVQFSCSVRTVLRATHETRSVSISPIELVCRAQVASSFIHKISATGSQQRQESSSNMQHVRVISIYFYEGQCSTHITHTHCVHGVSVLPSLNVKLPATQK